MREGDLSIIDTNQWKPVQSPGLRAPRHQVPYDSPEVQNLLSEAFGVMFPNIVEVKRGVKRYTAVNVHQKDVMLEAKPVKNINDIPKAEMMRLMEGWIRLRRKLQEGVVSKGVAGILLNFRVPNPRQSLDKYMLYKEGEESRLIIRWGYETKEEPAVSLERAISILMDVPLGHMRSILSTSMAPTTSTVPVGQMVASAAVGEGGRKLAGSIGGTGNYKVLFGVVAVSVVMLSLGILGISKALTTQEQSVPSTNPTEVLSSPPVQEAVVAEPVDTEELEEFKNTKSSEFVEVENTPVVVEVEEKEPIPSLDSIVLEQEAQDTQVGLSEMLGETAGSEKAPAEKKTLSLEEMLSSTSADTETDMLGEMLK
ncbi:hypothetical protein ACFPK9_08245 [Rubritalea spongiae]|uniref:Uncharacterized protein n=1 Tax=Rubritalea spongiae TaxID=430797 RepID=A0ABW5E167_9BACT